ncbi:MAG TPA: class I SAM-dependent methyltransferase [Acidimicrobiales bacterium]|nr:class I SAM-dependent methyltransferase [Acidimicrobiales bacterium]
MVTAQGETETSFAGPDNWGLRRSIELFRAFRGGHSEFDRFYRTDPQEFYRFQAADTVAQLRRYTTVAGKLVLDIGGGPGYFTEALTRAGARCVLVEPEAGAAARPEPPEPGPPTDGAPPSEDAVRQLHDWHITPGRLAPGRTIAGDGNVLPIPDGVADLTFSSNVLEHVASPAVFMDELIRVTRPGGLLYVSFTAWYSPWGGHETAPWHFLGGHRAARRYERHFGRPPGNLFGSSLFACHVGPTLRLARSHPGVDVVDALPRYYPDWMRWIVHVPAVRELATWNLLLVLRRRPAGS